LINDSKPVTLSFNKPVVNLNHVDRTKFTSYFDLPNTTNVSKNGLTNFFNSYTKVKTSNNCYEFKFDIHNKNGKKVKHEEYNTVEYFTSGKILIQYDYKFVNFDFNIFNIIIHIFRVYKL